MALPRGRPHVTRSITAGEDVTRRLEERILEIAARQHGVVTRKQLLGAGLTPRAVQGRVASGRLRLLHRGVYLVGVLAPPWARELAAVLACGPGARASHRTAASLWELAPRPDSAHPVEVKVPGHRVVRRAGIHAYRALGIAERAPASVHGIPTTDPTETLLDLARILSRSDLEKMIAHAERARLVSLDDLRTAADGHPRRRGMRTLRRLLAQERGPAFTRSDLEDRFRDAVRRFQLSSPRFNVRVHGYEVDCFWPDAGLAIELDGAAYHGSWRSQQNDRRRDGDLASRGIHVLRITWDQLTRETEPTMVRIAQALAIRRDRLRRAGAD
jgi:very-short-patch-repair endonuclease